MGSNQDHGNNSLKCDQGFLLRIVGGVLHAERVLKHVEGTDDICYDVLAAKAKKSY